MTVFSEYPAPNTDGKKDLPARHSSQSDIGKAWPQKTPDAPGVRNRCRHRTPADVATVSDARRVWRFYREGLAAENARRAGRQKPLPHPLESYAGIYESPAGDRMEWKVINGKLVVSFGPLW